MRTRLLTRLGAAPVLVFALLTAASLLLLSRPAGAVSDAASPADLQARARRWAGDLSSLDPTRTRRADGPGAFSDLSDLSGRSIAPESFGAGLDLEPTDTDGKWSLLAGSGFAGPVGPSRVTHTAIYHPGRQRVVIFGGGGDEYLNDTWTLNPSGSGQWQELETAGDPPAPRRLQSAIYDPVEDRMIVYGGWDGTFLGDVWQLSFAADPPTWSQITPAGTIPASRAGHGAIYDSAEQRLILFGGYDGESEPAQRRKDVWALSLGATPEWTDLTPAVDGPSARSSLDAVYDAARDRLVILGGTDPTFRDDIWALSLDGTPTWSAIDAGETHPSPREEQSAIYDAAHDRIVLFGGYDAEYYLGDTWSLALGTTTWTQLEPIGLGPGPRWGHTAVYDAANSRMILFGGLNGGAGLPDGTFLLTLSGTPAWTNPTFSPGPGPMRHTFASAYDSRRHRFVLFGGSNVASYLNDTWVITLDDHPLWSQLPTLGVPPNPRRLAEAIYDPEGDRLIVFAGFDDHLFGDLWQLSFLTDPPIWTPLVALGAPPSNRGGHAVIYDPRGKRMIVYAGWNGAPPSYRVNDTWALNLGGLVPVWERIQTNGTAPSPRSSHSTVYDSEAHRMIVLFGTAPWFVNEVWALTLGDEPTWTQLQPQGVPPNAREEQSAMYDPVRNRVIIFGGYENEWFQGTADTWELELGPNTKWKMMSPAGPQPVYRWGHAAVYDRSRDRMVMHGGYGPGLDQTWALTWNHPETAAPALVNAQAVSGVVRLTWVVPGTAFTANIYRSSDGTTWTPTGDATVDASSQAYFEDTNVLPGTRYAYRAGVQSGTTERLSDAAWVETPAPTAVLMTLQSSEATTAGVRLIWSGDLRSDLATVYRRTATTEWSPIARVTADGTGRVVFEDAAVVPGTRYAYRLGVTTGGVEEFTIESWVVVPERLSLRLEGFRPNPAFGELALAFSLADRSPATLEIIDTSGRRVFQRSLGDFGPGEHVLRLNDEFRLEAGVYMVRLTQSGRSVSRKASVIRF